MNKSDNYYKKRKAKESKSCLQKCKEMLKNKQNKRVQYFLSRDLNLSFEDQQWRVEEPANVEKSFTSQVVFC